MKTIKTMVAVLALGMLTLASTAEAGGPKKMVTSEVVPARTIKTYSMTFLGGEVAVVAVVGDGDTDLDLEVYDAFGNLVASDHGPTDTAVVRFFPLFTQVYTVKVINRGYVHNRFSLGNN